MLVEEMHIQIDNELQKVNTYTQRNLLPQEKDWFLNNEVDKFISQRTNPKSDIKGLGADKTTKRYEDLDDFTKEKDLVVYKNSDNTGTVILPDDYYAHIASKTNVYQLCSTDVITTSNKTVYKCVFPLSFPSDTTLTSYTITFRRNTGNDVVFNITSLPTGYIQDVDINKQRFMLLKAIKILLKDNLEALLGSENFNLYWERYGEGFYNNQFIITSETAFLGVTINVNNSDTNYDTTQDTYQYYDKSSELWGKNRLIEDEFKFHSEYSNLAKSMPHSLLVDLNQLVIKNKFPKNTICMKVRLRFISKPSILDLALNKNLNIKDSVAKEIVSNTVRFIKGVFQGDYETYLKENIMIE